MNKGALSFRKDSLNDYFFGDEEILIEAVEDFLLQVPKHLDVLKKSFNEKDFIAIEIAGHTLNGLCASFFAYDARELAIALEKRAKDLSIKDLDLINRLENELGKLCKELRLIYIEKKAA